MGGQPRSVEELEIHLDDGVRLHAEAYGDRHAPVTVVLLHGWTLDRRTWHRQLADLNGGAGAPARVIAYDARGHGRSSPTHRHLATLARLGDDLAAVIRQATGDGPVVLVGHSLGGMAIMEYAHRHPEAFAARVRGMVMVSTTAEGHAHTRYGLPGPLGTLVRLAEVSSTYVLARCGERHPHRAVMNAIRPAMRWLLFGDECDAEDLRLASSAVARASLRSIGGFRASISEQQRLDTLAALPPMPAAVLVGERDRLTPVRCAEGIAEALGGAEVVRCPGAGHMLMMERPEEVTGAIARVVREVAVASPATVDQAAMTSRAEGDEAATASPAAVDEAAAAFAAARGASASDHAASASRADRGASASRAEQADADRGASMPAGGLEAAA